MNKSTRSLVYSLAVAEILKLRHEELIGHLQALAKGLHLSRKTIPRIPGRQVALDMQDLFMLTARLGPTALSAQALWEHWYIHAEPRSSDTGRLLYKDESDAVVMHAVLDDKPLLRNTVRKLADGLISPADAAIQFGVRKEGDAVWIAAAHPYIAKLIRWAKEDALAFNRALAQIAGAKRMPPKKFGKIAMRSISVPIKAFLEATEPLEFGD